MTSADVRDQAKILNQDSPHLFAIVDDYTIAYVRKGKLEDAEREVSSHLFEMIESPSLILNEDFSNIQSLVLTSMSQSHNPSFFSILKMWELYKELISSGFITPDEKQFAQINEIEEYLPINNNKY